MRVMVALDGSDEALAGLEYVACLALGPADRVFLVSVAETDPVSAKAFRREHGRHLALLLEASWAAKRGAAQDTLERGRDLLGEWRTPVSQVIRSGHPVQVIAGLVEELQADLLVLGPQGVGGWSAALLGSVAGSLLGMAPCPVLVARRPVSAPARVVLAVDGSRHAEAATRVLTAFPLAARASIDVVCVVGPASTPPRDLPAEFSELDAVVERLAGETAERAARALAAAGIEASPTVRRGDPRREIVDAARAARADLVVLGRRGRTGLRGRLAGSVSQQVAGSAPCSVLVVPTPPSGRRGAN